MIEVNSFIRGTEMREYQIKRYSILMLGNIVIGLGVAILIKAGLGIDPFTLMNMGISQALGINFSMVQWIISIIILASVFFVDKKKIFVGTIMNMLLVAPLIQGFSWGINSMVPDSQNIWINILIVLIGCTVLSLGAGLYSGTDLGLSPYDLIAIIISERKPIHFRWMRIITDVICVIVGWILGSVVGIGTLVAALCMGPLIALFKEKTEEYLKKSYEKISEQTLSV